MSSDSGHPLRPRNKRRFLVDYTTTHESAVQRRSFVVMAFTVHNAVETASQHARKMYPGEFKVIRVVVG